MIGAFFVLLGVKASPALHEAKPDLRPADAQTRFARIA
ncbi:hypothetical protein SJ05684_c09370 [Sinorhizobium sojae CCBAU 05684]|uniref:Uncharacterized protein n=1 Tax=Sinorhizobium sojae CCBAU 05684 TaxID=716928 RepID=A0A249P958_9HYPH|nr:hypothetical protein SJ05684_c09370 [Sinorhizobium sojae CCBAU 05684]